MSTTDTIDHTTATLPAPAANGQQRTTDNGPLTTFDQKRQANRNNAQLSTGPSTGPRTPQGKSRSAQNAATHGLASPHLNPDTLVAQDEREAFAHLHQSFREHLAPKTPSRNAWSNASPSSPGSSAAAPPPRPTSSTTSPNPSAKAPGRKTTASSRGTTPSSSAPWKPACGSANRTPPKTPTTSGPPTPKRNPHPPPLAHRRPDARPLRRATDPP
jgi:hypothetical protein